MLARQMLRFLMLSCGLRLLLDGVLALLHLRHVPEFFSVHDIFADSLKSGLAERAVSAPLLTDPKIQHWAPLFRNYLLHNPYLAGGISVYCEPPLGTLQLMGVAKLMVLASPWAALAAEFTLYGLAVALFAGLLRRLHPLPARTALLLTAPLWLSYPALFMFDRGNFHSGYASICLAMYFCTAFTGSWRWLGIAALCYAINVRPNTAVVTMIELVLAPELLTAIGVPLLAAILSGLVFALSLFAAHRIDPAYSLQHFWSAYSLYQQVFVVHGAGLMWNDSLYSMVSELRHLLGLTPAYSARASHAVSAVAMLALAGFAWLAVTGRVRRTEAVFIAAAFCTVFTPVYAQYHVLIFAAVLVVFGLNTAAGATPPRLQSAWLGFAVLAAAAWAVDLAPSPATALLSLAGPVFVIARLRANEDDDLCTVVSLLVLSPIGGAYGNGFVISVLLTAALAVLYMRAAKRDVRMRFVFSALSNSIA